MHIFGIKIDQLDRKQVLKKIYEFLGDSKQHYIVTPNPEILLQAGRDEEFFYCLNESDLSVPDGVGLKFASYLMFKNLKIYPGADLTKDILKIAGEKKLRVTIVNWKRGLSKAEEIKEQLKATDYKLQVLDTDYKLFEAEIKKINYFKPDILFCTFGAPHQEKFIYHNLSKFFSVKLAIGVGASFDYISGKARRAPWFFRKIGFEWFWRLFGFLSKQRINRKKRIKNAVIKFPWKFFKWRFIWPFVYRDNVACFLYQKAEDKYQVLLVERQDEKGHWQIPQGGTDGLSIKRAGEKELSEEIRNKKFKFVRIYEHLYKYKFWDDVPGKYKFGAYKPQKHAGYRGQKQSLYLAEYFGADKDIKINFWDHLAWKWVDIDDFVNSVHVVRREAALIYLKKFNDYITHKT